MATTGPTAAPPGSGHADAPARADVELRLPADGAFASVLRTTAVGLAARLDFTIDDVEDLRIAVGEAHGLALDHAAPGSDLTCGFVLSPSQITAVVSVEVDAPPALDRESFAWQVLTTLASTADLEIDEGVLRVSLTLRSQRAGSPTPDAAPTADPDPAGG